MSQYSNKSSPWLRSPSQGLQQGGMHNQQNTVRYSSANSSQSAANSSQYGNQQYQSGQQGMGSMNQGGSSGGGGGSGGSGGGGGSSGGGQGGQGYNQRNQSANNHENQRVFTGTITKMHSNFGFIDEDVFFQHSSIKGVVPKIGERVLVEASFNPTMPFKWNATRVQLITSGPVAPTQSRPAPSQPSNVARSTSEQSYRSQTAYNSMSALQQQQHQQHQQQQPPQQQPQQQQQQQSMSRNQRSAPLSSSLSSQRRSDDMRGSRGPPMNDYGNKDYGDKESRRRSPMPLMNRRRSPNRRSPNRRNSPQPSSRMRSPRPSSVVLGRKSRSPITRGRGDRREVSRSPDRSRSRRHIPRYTVSLPKIQLDTKEVTVMSLKQRYHNLYIPSDFFSARLCWGEVFPLQEPLQLGSRSVKFHVRKRNVANLPPVHPDVDTAPVPSDASHFYSAKVMMLSTPLLQEIYNMTCDIMPTNATDFCHPSRIIEFLVGQKGKEPMIIGGPWSESEDGRNPDKDPQVLIRTAIRTMRQMTGVDLSKCTRWYRFIELKYKRSAETTKSGRQLCARVETVVIYLPDVWTCCPSPDQWRSLVTDYNRDSVSDNADDRVDQMENNDEEEEMEMDDDADTDDSSLKQMIVTDDSSCSVIVEDNNTTSERLHYSNINVKTMKVTELKCQLEFRSLSIKGLKAHLSARLLKSLSQEEETEMKNKASVDADIHAEEEMLVGDTTIKVDADDDDIDDDVKPDDEVVVVVVNSDAKTAEGSPKAKTDKSGKPKEPVKPKEDLRLKYPLPANPCIVVQPSSTIRNGMFDCKVQSLSILLDYRPEDKKEHTFELSLFSEMFNEMLVRDFGFTIYRSLLRENKIIEMKKAKEITEALERKEKEEQQQKADEIKKLAEEEETRLTELAKETENMDDEIKIIDGDEEDMFAEEEKKAAEEAAAAAKKETEKEEQEKEVKLKDEKLKSLGKRNVDDNNDASNDSEVKKSKTEDSKNKDRALKSLREKCVTFYPEALLAFTYFDQARTRYLLRSDIEDILHIIGLKLARSQIKKLVETVGFSSGRENAVHYHKITDVLESKITFLEEFEEDDLSIISQGNNEKNSESVDDGDSSVVVGESVLYKGSVINIKNTLAELKNSVDFKIETDIKLQKALEDKKNIEGKLNKCETTIDIINKQLSDLKYKLSSEETRVRNTDSHLHSQRALLEKVQCVLNSLTDDVSRNLNDEKLKKKLKIDKSKEDDIKSVSNKTKMRADGDSSAITNGT